MADVLIRGMEMPQRCLNCPFKQFLLLGNRNICLANMGKLIKYTDFSERDKNCPLVSLPEKHGRLGDLDKINASLEAMIEIEDNHNDAPHSWSHAYTEMQSILDDAPTIVPAEGDVNDGA